MRKLSRLAGRLRDGLLGCLAQSAHVPPLSRFVGVPASTSLSLLNSSSSQSSQSSGMDSSSPRGVLRRMAPARTSTREVVQAHFFALLHDAGPPGVDTSFLLRTKDAFPATTRCMHFQGRCALPATHQASMVQRPCLIVVWQITTFLFTHPRRRTLVCAPWQPGLFRPPPRSSGSRRGGSFSFVPAQVPTPTSSDPTFVLHECDGGVRGKRMDGCA